MPLEVAVEAVLRKFVPLEMEVVYEMVTRAAAKLSSVVHILFRNTLLEVVAAEGQTLIVNLAKAWVRDSTLDAEAPCRMWVIEKCSTLLENRYNACNSFAAIRLQRTRKLFRPSTDMSSNHFSTDILRSMGNPFSFFLTHGATASTKMLTGISNNLGATKSSQPSDRSTKNVAAEMFQKQ